MALRDQPYLPLYIQDFLTDEKLNECSAASTGVYAKLMCLMHKSDDYGKMLLKQKYKTSESKERNFALMLARLLPFTFDEILNGITELIAEKVIYIEGDFLCQKRMIKDNNLSTVRQKAGQKGGNAGPTKSWSKPGFIYLISNEDKHKIGLSTDPLKRLGALRFKFKLPDLQLIDSIPVLDMGAGEDEALDHFKDCINGEWLTCDYTHAVEQFSIVKKKLSKAKDKANTEYEIDNVIEINNKTEEEISREKKFCDEILAFFGFNEINHFKNFTLFRQAYRLFDAYGNLEHFIQQCQDYKKYIEHTGERFRHRFEKFLGKQEEGFAGVWNDENWNDKLKNALEDDKSDKGHQYSRKLEITLQGKDLTDYWAKLRSWGFSPKKDRMNNIVDWVKIAS